jgi:hypothetical protein
MAARKNQTAVSDEQIIAALLGSGSIAKAAEATGIAPRTIYDRMGTREFKAAYSAAKSDLVRRAVLDMSRSLSAAVEVVTGIMNDDGNPASIRLQAAKMVIENAAKFTDRLDKADATTADAATGPFGFDPAKW